MSEKLLPDFLRPVICGVVTNDGKTIFFMAWRRQAHLDFWIRKIIRGEYP